MYLNWINKTYSQNLTYTVNDCQVAKSTVLLHCQSGFDAYKLKLWDYTEYNMAALIFCERSITIVQYFVVSILSLSTVDNKNSCIITNVYRVVHLKRVYMYIILNNFMVFENINILLLRIQNFRCHFKTTFQKK